MAASDEFPGVVAAGGGEVPGRPMTVGSKILEAGAEMLQSMKPLKKMTLHSCTFALYSYDLTRQIETHHYVSRLNNDFLQCAVYDSDDAGARLIGVEYIVSDSIFESLPVEEQKLWHSHAYEIKSGLWMHPGVPEVVQRAELKNLAKTYGKFWCTWQTDRGDRLPMGMPALMMSPQGVEHGRVKEELVERRDRRYGVSRKEMMKGRVEIEEPEWINPNADYWKKSGKGFVIERKEVDMVLKHAVAARTLPVSAGIHLTPP
ncbi:unnamed protein product [Victoria cruziana]